MSYCLNPVCPSPQNADDVEVCQCGATLRLNDRYMAIRSIGQGGFGRTFLAVDLAKPGKPRCVIKQFFPNARIDRIKAIILFREEAECLKQIDDHPQISDLFDYLEQGEQQYLIQEFIDGQNLEQELTERNAFSESEIRQLLMDLLPVLQFMHDRQVIHRDIKPANIIRQTVDRKLVLVDMGAAKYATGTALARTGTIIGSAEYTAPEQARGRAVFASDIYSLGVTCIHLLTQISPFDLFDTSSDRWVWRNYLHQPVSNQLARILDKMLQNATSFRYQSASEVLKDLQSIESVTSEAKSVQTVSQKVEYAEPKPIAIDSDLSFDRGGSIAVDDSDQALFDPNQKFFGRGLKFWFAATLAIFFSIPIAVWWQIRDRSIRTIKIGDSVESIAITPDGKTIASSIEGDIYQENRSAARIELWNLQTGESIKEWNIRPELKQDPLGSAYSAMYDIAITPDGKTLVGGGYRTLRTWNLQTGALLVDRTLPNSDSSRIDQIMLSSNGRSLVTSEYFGNDRSRLWTLPALTLKRTVQAANQGGGAVAISPDGKTIATVGADRDPTIYFQDLQTGQQTRTLNAAPYDLNNLGYNALAFSPDGKLLIASVNDYSDAQFDVWNLQTGTRTFQLTAFRDESNTGEPLPIAISPDSRILVVGNGETLQLWDLITGEQNRMLRGHRSKVNAIAFSPDGKTLISGDSKGEIKIWQIP